MSARRCTNPVCSNSLPEGATTRRRYCSGACRQAHHRTTHPSEVVRPAPDAQLQATLAEVARAHAAGLAVAAQELADLPLGDQAVRSAYTARLPELVREVLAAAVRYDRAVGLTWEDIGEWLELHPDTARSRYGIPGKH